MSCNAPTLGYTITGRLIGLAALLLLLAPWSRSTAWASDRSGFATMEALGHATLETMRDVYADDPTGLGTLEAFDSRRTLAALLAVGTGALTLVVAPRRRFPRAALGGAVLLASGTASFFVAELAGGKTTESRLWCDAFACVPLALGLASAELIRRWDERAIWVGGVNAYLCLALLLPLGDAPWPARLTALVAAIAFVHEAWTWDELPRPGGPAA